MEPGKRDHKHSILIAGAELQELKRHTYMMAESFGLDNRIDRYKGLRQQGAGQPPEVGTKMTK